MTSAHRPPTLEWEIDVPLLTNRHFIGGFAKAMLGSGVMVVALVSLGLGVQGEWRAIPAVAGLLLAIAFALFVLGLLVMAFPFRNRMRTRFSVSEEGVRLQVVDRASRAASRASLLAGVVLGSGAAAGAGLLSAAQEDRQLRWKGAFRAIPEPGSRSIAFRNGWRTLMRIYCTADGFPEAVAAVQGHMETHGTARRCAGRSPLGGYLLRTVLVVVAMLPVFAVRGDLGYGLLAPWIVLCFAIAVVWLVRPLAWVVLLGEAFLVVWGVASATRGRRILSGDDRFLGVLALAGLAYLAWLSIATLAGKVRPALQADWNSSGES